MSGIYLWVLAAVVLLSYGAVKCDYVRENIPSEGVVRHSNAARFCFICAALILMFVSGLRYDVGADFGAYYGSYKRYAGEFWDSLKTFDEPGIRFIYFILDKFTSAEWAPTLVCSLIAVGIALREVYRRTDCFFLALSIYMFIGCWSDTFNGVRQTLAAAIVYAGSHYIKEKKLLKYAVIIFVAYLFHRSALLMGFAYYLLNRKTDAKNVGSTLVAAIVLFFSFDRIYNLTERLLNRDLSKDTEYVTREVNIFRILVAIAPTVFFLIILKNAVLTKADEYNLNCLIINTAVMIAAAGSSYFARYGMYTSLFSAVAIPELCKKLDVYNRKIAYVVIWLLYFAYWLYLVNNSGSIEIYHFVWES